MRIVSQNGKMDFLYDTVIISINEEDHSLIAQAPGSLPPAIIGTYDSDEEAMSVMEDIRTSFRQGHLYFCMPNTGIMSRKGMVEKLKWARPGIRKSDFDEGFIAGLNKAIWLVENHIPSPTAPGSDPDTVDRQYAASTFKKEIYPAKDEYDRGFMSAIDKAIRLTGKKEEEKNGQRTYDS